MENYVILNYINFGKILNKITFRHLNKIFIILLSLDLNYFRISFIAFMMYGLTSPIVSILDKGLYQNWSEEKIQPRPKT